MVGELITDTTALSILVKDKPKLAEWVNANAQFGATVGQETATAKPSATIDQLLRDLGLKKDQFLKAPLQAQHTDHATTHGLTIVRPARPGSNPLTEIINAATTQAKATQPVGDGVHFTTTGSRDLAASIAQTLLLKGRTMNIQQPRSKERILLQSTLAFLSDATLAKLKALQADITKSIPISEQDALLITAIHTLHVSFERISQLPDIVPVKDISAETATRNLFHAFALARYTLGKLDATISGTTAAAKATGDNPRRRLVGLAS